MKWFQKAVSGILCVVLLLGMAGCSSSKQEKLEGELTVSVYRKEEWLETAGRLFEDKYPGVKVTINSFYDPTAGTDIYSDGGLSEGSVVPTGQTREDYLSELNTKILSGKAEDVIMTSTGLPVDRYIYMGVFEDLSGYLEKSEEFNEENYYMNLFDACRTKDGGLYQFPLVAIAEPLIGFDKALMEHTGVFPAEGTEKLSWREALNLAKEMYDKSTLPNTFMVDMRVTVGNIFTKAAMDGIDYETGTVNLDRERILDILKVFVEMADYKTMPEKFDYSREFHIPFNIRYQMDVEMAMNQLFYKSDEFYQWEYDDGKVYLCPYYAMDFGINSSSKQKELAWEFLKFMASDEIQTLPSFPWAGVNKKGLAARTAGRMTNGETQYSEEEIQLAVTQLERWILQINAYRPEDADLITLTEGELNQFLNGNQTALETVDSLERKLQQYINE